MTPCEFAKLLNAYEFAEKKRLKEKAEFTALIINCCGNLKKKITANDILGISKSGYKITSREVKNREIKALKELFGSQQNG